MALKGKQVKDATLNLNLLKTNASAADEGKIMIFDANDALAIYDPLVFGASSVNMTGDVIVTGDLSVNGGTITSFDTVDLSLEDNIVRVAASAGVAGDGGFAFTTVGGGSTIELFWNESASEWKVKLAAGTEHIIADVAAMEDADSIIQGSIDALAVASSAAEDVLQGEIDDEAADRLAADQVLSGTVNGNTSTLSTNLGLSETALSNEETRSSGARATLSSELSTEIARAKAAESALHSSITGETARATAAEGGLSTDISNESTRAQGKEAELGTLISNESSRAQAAEAAIDARITGQTAARIYDYDSLDFEIDDIRYGDEGSSFVLGTHNGPDGSGEYRFMHPGLQLNTSLGTVSAGTTIPSFSAYTENDAKVAEGVIDKLIYNNELMRLIIAGDERLNEDWYALSSYVDQTTGELINSGPDLMSSFDSGEYNLSDLIALHELAKKEEMADDAYYLKQKAKQEAYSHTVTHSISSSISTGTLTIPAMEKISDVFNATNISGYWGVQAGGADLRNWANRGDINVRINGLELSEDAVSYNVADKDGNINSTYSSLEGVGSNATFNVGGLREELQVQLTAILINVDKVGYPIDSDDVIEIIYDKMRGKAVSENYSPDAEVTECGDATASNYVPNAYAYDNALCQYAFPVLSGVTGGDVAIRVSFPQSTYDGRFSTLTNHDGAGLDYASQLFGAVGDLTIEVGTVDGNGQLTSWGSATLNAGAGTNNTQVSGLAEDIEVNMHICGGSSPLFQGFPAGRGYFKINAANTENPYYGHRMIVEMYKAQPGDDFDMTPALSDRLMTFGGAARFDKMIDGELQTRLYFHNRAVGGDENIFPDGVFELGNIYYFTVV